MWFEDTTFQADGDGHVVFKDTTFQTDGEGHVGFGDATFRTNGEGSVWFGGARSQTDGDGDVLFRYATFQTDGNGHVVFKDTTFQTDGDGHVVFVEAALINAIFAGADFDAADLGGADLWGCSIDYTELAKIKIDEGTTFGGKSQWEVDADKEAREAISVPFLSIRPLRCLGRWRTNSDSLGKATRQYRATQRALRENDLREMSELEIREKHALRKKALADREWWTWLVWAFKRWPLGYGEQPKKVIGTSLLVIAAGMILYPIWGLQNTGGNPTKITYSASEALAYTWGKSAYFSTITFTTVRYGDLQPIGWAQTIATLESFIGALLMAYLVFVLGRRVTW